MIDSGDTAVVGICAILTLIMTVRQNCRSFFTSRIACLPTCHKCPSGILVFFPLLKRHGTNRPGAEARNGIPLENQHSRGAPRCTCRYSTHCIQHLKIPSSSLRDLKHHTADPEPLNQPPPRQPGISFFYGGLVHRHTVISILMQCITSMALTSIVWAVWGFSLAFGESGGGFMGSPSSYPFFSNLSPCTPLGYPMVMIPRKTS